MGDLMFCFEMFGSESGRYCNTGGLKFCLVMFSLNMAATAALAT